MLNGRRWAKSAKTGEDTFHDLLAHGLDVAAVLQVGLKGQYPLLTGLAHAFQMSTEQTFAFLGAMAALHDIGKAAASFQFLDPALAARLGVRQGTSAEYDRKMNGHDRIGHAMLLNLCRSGDLFSTKVSRPTAEEIIGVFTFHHGAAKAYGGDACYTQNDLEYGRSFVRLTKELFGWDGTVPDLVGLRRVSYITNGALNLADWLGSDTHFEYVQEVNNPAAYLEGAKQQAHKLIQRIRPSLFYQPDAPEPLSFDELFPEFTDNNWKPSALQSLCDEWIAPDFRSDGPVLVVIEDLTGAGKTEASDLVTHRLVAAGLGSGAFYGLPTMATSDKAFERRTVRIDRMAGVTSDKALLHSRARDRLELFKSTAFRDNIREGDAACLDWFTRDSKRGLLVPWSVGTIDQALFSVLRTEHATIRQGGLLGKVLIVDEVHGLDTYMTGLLEVLISSHASLGGSVVLMSATLPSAARDRLVEAFCRAAGYAFTVDLDPAVMPSLTMISSHGVRQQDISEICPPAARPVTLRRTSSEDHVVDQILKWAEAGKSAVWFRNTVADARRGHERLAEALKTKGLPAPILYHSRFLPSDRAKIEEIVTVKAGKESTPDQRRSFILVSTQVAEQSLDLDFDEIATDLAPMDVLLQRFGRRGRHIRFG